MFDTLMAFGFGIVNGMIYMALVVKLYKRSRRGLEELTGEGGQ